MLSASEISSMVEEKKGMFLEANDRIWEFAETRFQEYKSAELLSEILEKEGFEVRRGLAGLSTAFVATYGTGSPKIGILGEYDALYGMNQKSSIAVKEAEIEGASGHGCGHNSLGVGSLSAAVAVKDYLQEHNIKGTVYYFGCPGEEGGSGKTYMVREGVFDDIDAAFSWHPGNINGIVSTSSLANIQAYFKFYGKSAHAAACPHLGRSSLDAVGLMNVGVNFLREHVISEARMHYAITNGGGLSPNVVQAYSEVLYLVRAPKMSQTKEIYERVVNIAKGAALMTDTKLEIVFDKAASNLVVNDTLSKIMYEKMTELGVTKIDGEDIKFAEEIRNTLSQEEKSSDFKSSNKAISDFIKQYEITDMAMPGSTDVGDVSWVVPTSQINTACYALGTPGHSWQLVAQGKSNLAHKGLLFAAKVIALSTLELFENTEKVEEAKRELKKRLNGEQYICPIPKDIKPSLKR